MRLAIILVLVLPFIGVSCKKGISPGSSVPFSLPGTWRLVKYQGGFAGGTIIPTTSQAQTYIFKADSTLTIITPGNTTNTTYSITTDATTNPPTQTLTFGNGMMPAILTHMHDTLALMQANIADGYTYFFVK